MCAERMPRLLVDLPAIVANVKALVGLCGEYGVSVCGVTKGCGGERPIAEAFVRGGVAQLADSRLDNLEKYGDLSVPRLLIRTPAPSEADRVVCTADVSINTELATLQALDAACARQGVERHGVMLMLDLGDLREGIVDYGELCALADFVRASERLYVYGVGANLNCLSFVLPDADKMAELSEVARKLGERMGLRELVVSGGNSTNVHMLMSGESLGAVNSLRLGEALLFGRERAAYGRIPGTRDDVFRFQAQIVELKKKPSLPWGTAGVDSYGRRHTFEDRGLRMRAVLSFGHLDSDVGVMRPVDDGVQIVGSSSDHTVVDVTDSHRAYCVGDIIEFACGYHAVAHAFASPYVEKVFIEG